MVPHYVLTRSIYDPAQCDSQMVRRRLAVFAAVTVPSIAAQTDRSFTWVIAVHANDPFLAERRRLAESAGVPVVLVEMASGPTPRLSAAAAYSHGWDLDSSAKLTTRLDDDDGLTRDFMHRLRAAASTGSGLRAFIFPWGYRVVSGRWDRYHHPRNMFASVLTPDGEPRNVCNWPHMKIRDEMPTVDIDTDPAWCFFRHADTISGAGAATRLINPRLRAKLPFDWSTLEGR